MKKLTIIFSLLISGQIFANEKSLLCNDQNSHSVYRLQLSDDRSRAQLINLVADSSILSVGTKELRFQEGESSAEEATYAGKTNSGLNLALLFNSTKAAELNSFEVLEVSVFFQQKKGDILSGRTVLLCSMQ